jgi:drug/metabolite transporter (DMT)-like permease
MPAKELQQRKSNQGFLIAFVSAIILSFTSILIRIISENYHLPALILAFWRDIFVAVCALPFFIILKPKLLSISQAHILFLIAFGAVLALFNILWTLAVILTGAAIATVLVYSSAGFTAILGRIFLKEKLGWFKIITVCLCLAGCLLVSGAMNSTAWQTNALGIVTGTLSGLLYAVYSLLGRSAAKRGLNPWTTLFYTFLCAALILLAINLFPYIPGTATHPKDMFLLGSRWRGWGLLILLAAGPTLVGFGLYNVSLGLLPSSTANLILTLEPVITGVVAYIFLGERLTFIEGIGSGLILLALLLIRVRNAFNERVKRNT